MGKEVARLHARIYGRVQGVSFRYYTQKEAMSRELCGWVSNCVDGSVKLVAEGDRTALNSLLLFLHRGSPAARVDRVEVEWATATGEFDRFRVRFLD